MHIVLTRKLNIEDRDLPGMHNNYQDLSSGNLMPASTFWTAIAAVSQGKGIDKWRVFEVVMESARILDLAQSQDFLCKMELALFSLYYLLHRSF